MTVNIRPPTIDVAATKVRLLALSDDPAKTKEILADDEQTLAQILPYSVLLKNESERKLRAIGVRFSWTNAEGRPRGLILTLTMMMHEADPSQMAPGDYQLFTPVQAVNQYLAQAPQARKRGRFQQPSSPSVGQFSSLSLTETVQQGLDELAIPPGGKFEAFLEGVVFEDYSYVGSKRLLESLQRYNNLIH
jgi:hypothetical protein